MLLQLIPASYGTRHVMFLTVYNFVVRYVMKINYNYVLCLNKEKNQLEKDILCYDGLDKNSSIIRNANDAHGSTYRNNCYFYQKKLNGKYKVLAVCKRNIKAFSEIFIDYGDSYFNNF